MTLPLGGQGGLIRGRGMSSLDDFRNRLVHDAHVEIFDYWVSKMHGERLPGRADIDPVDIPRLLGRTLLVDVLPGVEPGREREGTRFRYRVAGSLICNVIGVELTGMHVDELHDKQLAREVHDLFMKVCDTRMPELTFRRKPAAIDRDVLGYDLIVLPLASDGHTVDMLMMMGVFLFEASGGVRSLR